MLGSSSLSCPGRNHSQMPSVHCMFFDGSSSCSEQRTDLKARHLSILPLDSSSLVTPYVHETSCHHFWSCSIMFSKYLLLHYDSMSHCCQTLVRNATDRVFFFPLNSLYLWYGAGHCPCRLTWPSGLFSPCKDSANKKHPKKGNIGFCWGLLTCYCFSPGNLQVSAKSLLGS